MTVKTARKKKFDPEEIFMKAQTIRAKYEAENGFSDEYDDNQGTIRVYFLEKVFGMQIEWSTYHIERNLAEVVKAVKECTPANSVKLITGSKKKLSLERIEALKDVESDSGFGFYGRKYPADMIDFCIECLNRGYDLDTAVEDLLFIS